MDNNRNSRLSRLSRLSTNRSRLEANEPLSVKKLPHFNTPEACNASAVRFVSWFIVSHVTGYINPLMGTGTCHSDQYEVDRLAVAGWTVIVVVVVVVVVSSSSSSSSNRY